jgi:autophagy-related protein 9
VCSFAVFDFKKGVGISKQTRDNGDLRDDYYSTKHGKMAASYYGFLDNYVINPKTGIPGHLPPSSRNHFHPPPAFPGLNSPTLAAEMQAPRLGRGEQARSRAPGGLSQANRTPRPAPVPSQPSPMASILLDPHHQPAAPVFEIKSTPRSRQARGGYQGDSHIIEESAEDAADVDKMKHEIAESIHESGHDLDQSAWQTSPTKPLSRDNSSVGSDEPDIGVLGLMYQFQHHMNQRTGAIR